MPTNLANIVFLLVGILAGIVVSMGLKYPLQIETLDKVKDVCKDDTIRKVHIGISGKIYEVECTKGTVFKLD